MGSISAAYVTSWAPDDPNDTNKAALTPAHRDKREYPRSLVTIVSSFVRIVSSLVGIVLAVVRNVWPLVNIVARLLIKPLMAAP